MELCTAVGIGKYTFAAPLDARVSNSVADASSTTMTHLLLLTFQWYRE